MSSREDMLTRVREALQRSGAPARSLPLPEAGRALAPIPPAELVERFEAEMKAVAGACHRASSTSDLQQTLREILPSAEGVSAVVSRNPLLFRLPILRILKEMNYATVRWPEGNEVSSGEVEAFRNDCFSATAGVTGADFALAESGTLVLSSATEGSQLASLAPSIHIALYTRSQVVESLEEVLERLTTSRTAEGKMEGRSVVFITGVSRTSDIEQVSIRGVHGPTQLHAILIEEACFG